VASGEIDIASSPELRDALLEPQAQGDTLVLDLREVTFIDSSGLGVIAGQRKRAQEDGHHFAVAVDGTSAVHRVLSLSGLTKLLDIVADPAERLAG